jgi:hypothetical protein
VAGRLPGSQGQDAAGGPVSKHAGTCALSLQTSHPMTLLQCCTLVFG